jgi:hypothetical protein
MQVKQQNKLYPTLLHYIVKNENFQPPNLEMKNNTGSVSTFLSGFRMNQAWTRMYLQG